MIDAKGISVAVAAVVTSVLQASSQTPPPPRPPTGGGGWVMVSSPSAGTADNSLHGMTCVGINDCWAVGGDGNTPLIEQFTSSAWGSVKGTSGTQGSLLDVTCVTARNCWAVGTYTPPGGVPQPLIDHYSGASWATVSSPSIGTAQANTVLNHVTCVTAAVCWAVGSYETTGNTPQTLVERYDGRSWTIVSSPNPASYATLQSVTCVSTADCWAVGYEETIDSSQELILHYDGSVWTAVTGANPKGADLQGVTCLSAAGCWAVGSQFDGSVTRTLIEQYNGSGWGIVAGSDPGTFANTLAAVTCATGSDCWAVGTFASGNPPSPFQTLVEQYDGTGWTLASSANSSAAQENALSGLYCVSATDCWAAGEYKNSGGIKQTLIEQYLASSSMDATATRLSCTPSSDPHNKPTTCAATVTDTINAPNTPIGVITFRAAKGAFSSTTCTLISGSCSVTFTPTSGAPRTTVVTASYGGDGGHSTSRGQFKLRVT